MLQHPQPASAVAKNAPRLTGASSSPPTQALEEPTLLDVRRSNVQPAGVQDFRTGGGGSFNPFRGPTMHVAHVPINESPPVEVLPPIEDQLERFLVLLFLRRYVTYCARGRQFAAMEGAARLRRQVLTCGSELLRPL